MLTEEQEKTLHLAIIDYLTDNASLKSLVGVEIAGCAPMNVSYNVTARFVIRRCKMKVEVLRKVLKALDPLEEDINLVSLHTLANNWQPAPITELFAALEFSGGPFVDRDHLRNELRNLSSNTAQPILLVNGELGLGKSYSCQMISEVISIHADYQIAKLRAEPTSPSIWQIKDVAEDIVRNLSNPQHLPPPTHAVAGDRLAGLYADWTAEEIARSGDTLWIMLDGFGHPDIPTETGMYIDEILTMAGSDTRLQRLRVLLFDFDAGRIRSLTERYNSLVLHLPDYDELLAYFKALYPDQPDYYWESTAAAALQDVPPPGPAYMPKIQLNVKRVTDVLR